MFPDVTPSSVVKFTVSEEPPALEISISPRQVDVKKLVTRKANSIKTKFLTIHGSILFLKF